PLPAPEPTFPRGLSEVVAQGTKPCNNPCMRPAPAAFPPREARHARRVRQFSLEMGPMTAINDATSAHDAAIADQFTRQAAQFAASAAHHNQAALDLLVEAARPRPEDVSLDVACGPGSVVAAFALRVHRAEGLDATEAMLNEARKLAAR